MGGGLVKLMTYLNIRSDINPKVKFHLDINWSVVIVRTSLIPMSSYPSCLLLKFDVRWMSKCIKMVFILGHMHQPAMYPDLLKARAHKNSQLE